MKTVTDNFVHVQKKPDAKPVRVVEYKRRKWNQTTRAFEWEASWTQAPDDDVASVSAVNWQLDTDQLNEFKVSNVTVTFRNDDGKYNTDNPFGIFGTDDGSPYNGYEPFWTKFRIRGGFRLEDGTEELVTVFTGLLSPDPIYESEKKTVQFPLQGLEAILINTKAQDMANLITGELVGTGNGATVDFNTSNPGVGGVTLITSDGVAKVEGQHYTISQLNDATLTAKISFIIAPLAGVKVRASYFYWPQSYQFHELVSALLDAADIADANQDVQSVIFSNSVLNSQEYTLQADWDAGTKDSIDTTRAVGSMMIDWTSSNLRQLTTWSQSMTGWTQVGGDFSSDGTYINANQTVSSPSSVISRAQTSVVSSWEFKYTCNQISNTNVPNIDFFFICAMNGSNLVDRGWAVNIQNRADGGVLGLARQLSGETGPTNFQTYGFTADTSEHTVKIVAYKGGVFKVYFDGTLRITGTDSAIPLEGLDHTAFRTLFRAGATSWKVRDIYVPKATYDATWESGALDLLAVPSAWGTLDSTYTADGTTITIQTKTSTNNVTYEAYVSLSSNSPQSGLKRYEKTKVIFTLDLSKERDPVFNDYTFHWTTSGTPVVLPAAFTDKNVYEAIQILGAYTNYEFGFSPDEVFFFRARDTDASVMDVNQSDYGSKIYGFVPGYERVFGTVRVTYGDITKEVTDGGDHLGSPKARVNDNIDEFTADDGIIISASSDIATGVATGRFNYHSKLRPRFKIATKFIPQLDLSDAITVTHANVVAPKKMWYLGSPDVNMGDKDIMLWGEKEQLAYAKVVKIIGARYDLERFGCEFDVEEVVE